jgi:hypothetical protein
MITDVTQTSSSNNGNRNNTRKHRQGRKKVLDAAIDDTQAQEQQQYCDLHYKDQVSERYHNALPHNHVLTSVPDPFTSSPPTRPLQHVKPGAMPVPGLGTSQQNNITFNENNGGVSNIVANSIGEP